MTFNLLTDPAFPVIDLKGARRLLTFGELANDDPSAPIAFDYPRDDLNVAAVEFAIGITTLALRPTRETDWLRLWRAPPNPDTMREKLTPFLHAFELYGDGDGPQFQQELGGFDGETTRIEALLIDSPGVSGQKKNTDLLTHRDRYPALGLPAAGNDFCALCPCNSSPRPAALRRNRTSNARRRPADDARYPRRPGTSESDRRCGGIILANVVATPRKRFRPRRPAENPAVARSDPRLGQGPRRTGRPNEHDPGRLASAAAFLRHAAAHRPLQIRRRPAHAR